MNEDFPSVNNYTADNSGYQPNTENINENIPTAEQNNSMNRASDSAPNPADRQTFQNSYSTVQPTNRQNYQNTYSASQPTNRQNYQNTYSAVQPTNQQNYQNTYSASQPTNRQNYQNTYSAAQPTNRQNYQNTYSAAQPTNRQNYQNTYTAPQTTERQSFQGAYSTPQRAGRNYSEYSPVTPQQKPQQFSNTQQAGYSQRPFNLSGAYGNSPYQSYAAASGYMPGTQTNIQYPPYYPGYTYVKSPREQERDSIRKSAATAGKETLIIFLLMQGLAIIIMIIGMFTGLINVNDVENAYSGFSQMGYYLFEGALSIVSIAIPTFIIIKSSGQRLDYFLPFKKTEGKALAALTVAGMAVCMLAQIIPTILGMNLSLFGIDIFSNLESETPVSTVDFIMSVICTAILPALVEELAFRGLVLGALKKHGDMFAVIASAFLFGMLHGNFVQIPFAFIVGLVLGLVRVKTDSMLPSILIHFSNNFFAVIITMISESFSENISGIIDGMSVTLLIIAGIISLWYLVKNEKQLFEYESDNGESSLFTFKEKMKIFLTNGFVIADIILLTITSVTLLAPIDEIASGI